MISFRLPSATRRRGLIALLAAGSLSLLAVPFLLTRTRPQPAHSPDALDSLNPNRFANDAMRRVLTHDLPLALDPATVYPSAATLRGAPFRPMPLAVTMEALSSGVPAGDYTLAVIGFDLPDAGKRADDGVAYRIGPMRGKASGAIATLLWRGLASGASPDSLYPAACAIQSGVAYAKLPRIFQRPIDQFIPDMVDEALSGDFFEAMQTAYTQAMQRAPESLTLRSALIAGGPLGRSAMEAVNERSILLRRDLSDPLREKIITLGDSSGVYTPAKPEDAPWVETVPGSVYMRLHLNAGNPSTGTLDLRILPPWEAPAASAGAPRELPSLMSLFGARFAPDGRVRVAGLVGYPVFGQTQPVTFFPVAAR